MEPDKAVHPTVRPYTGETEGRADVNGTVWFACDPYPTWFRWEDGVLTTPPGGTPDFGKPDSGSAARGGKAMKIEITPSPDDEQLLIVTVLNGDRHGQAIFHWRELKDLVKCANEYFKNSGFPEGMV